MTGMLVRVGFFTNPGIIFMLNKSLIIIIVMLIRRVQKMSTKPDAICLMTLIRHIQKMSIKPDATCLIV